MEKKIHRRLILIAFISILVTLCLCIGIFYKQIVQQISNDLKTFGHVVLETEGWENAKDIANHDNIRITLIDVDGTVLFDSKADVTTMQNHNDRPEVIEARLNKKSDITRKSSTFSNLSTYYYAMCLEDNRVLRVSKEVNSSLTILANMLPFIGILFIVLLMFAVSISRYLTKSIIQPITEIASNVDHLEDVHIDKELIPFVETIKKQHENILKQYKSRQDFTANVTHELKTPLTSISGYSELIETGMASYDDIKHFAHEIHRSSNRLLTTINDIIRLSELDSEVDLTFEKVDLYEIAKDSINSLEINADKYEVRLYLHGNNEIVHANRECMIELIYNLVDNAIRYNKKNGRVDITIGHDLFGSYIKVKDNGIGISKNYHERIFERFYRVDKSRSKATGGTGLGLAIVKHIVKKHQALLRIESEEGLGTEILIYFHKES